MLRDSIRCLLCHCMLHLIKRLPELQIFIGYFTVQLLNVVMPWAINTVQLENNCTATNSTISTGYAISIGIHMD